MEEMQAPPSRLLMQPLAVNSHFKEIKEFFGDVSFGKASIPDHVKFVFVCFTNRSGSNYLAELLGSSGKLNVADESLNSFHVIRISKAHGLKSFQEYFSYLVNTFQKNDTFCIKIAIPHLDLLRKSGILDQIVSRTKFIMIERSDKLGQAISHVIAFETEKYTSQDAGRKSEADLVFSKSQITEVMKGIVRSNAQMDMFFAMNCLTPVNVSYELILKDPVYTMSFVAQHIGFPDLEIVVPNVKLKKQSGAINENWRINYLLEE